MTIAKIKTLQVVLVPAASTELHDQNRICGSLDIPLSAAGIQQVEEVASQLTDRSIKIVYSAVCLAAQQTARSIADKSSARFRVVDTWRNLDHGLWHGKCLEEIKENHPKFYRQWVESPETVAPPNGETYADVQERVLPAVQRIVKKHSQGSILIVAPQPLLQILGDMFQSVREGIEIEIRSSSKK